MQIRIHDYRILYDGQTDGHDACAGSLAWVGGELWCSFAPAFEDDEAGHHPWLIRTKDLGKTWSAPEPFGPGVIQNAGRESIFLSLNGPSRRGTLFANGFHMQLGAGNQGRFYEDQSYRAYHVFIGRKETGRARFDWKWFESISLIRAREKLGRLADSPEDTWFYRSISLDDGETWSKPQPTNLPGTGATGAGLTLPDRSLLQACRIPCSRTLYALPDERLYGLHIARSFDDGGTWETAAFLQRDPGGNPFSNYYNTLNGQFVELGAGKWWYTFGQFDLANKRHRLLSVTIEESRQV